MKAKKRSTLNEHGPRTKTPAGRSVFRDLFATEEAAELEIRSILLRGLEHWLASSGMIQAKAAEVLGIHPGSMSDIKCSTNRYKSSPSKVTRTPMWSKGSSAATILLTT